MPTPKSPARHALDELLFDGDWVIRHYAIDHIAAHVPPGQAIRQAHRNRARLRARRGNPGPPRTGMGGAATADDQARALHPLEWA